MYAAKQFEHAFAARWNRAAYEQSCFLESALSLITEVMIIPESAMNMLTQIGRTLWTSALSYRCFDSHASPKGI
jgi:hypothetical protein